MSTPRTTSGGWADGALSPGVRLGNGSLIEGAQALKRFYSKVSVALIIGDRCTLQGVQFAAGLDARIEIGHHCYLNNTVVMAELLIQIGNYVGVGWNTTNPEVRRQDLLCLPDRSPRSPQFAGAARPLAIGSNVWIGFDVCILPGVRVGDGSIIGARSVVTEDVPPYCIAAGNPARVLRQIEAPVE